MNALMSGERLAKENARFFATGGRSEENASFGFRPAFRDLHTQAVYPSCFADGRAAPFHLLDGLPDHLVLSRNASGRVVAVKSSVVSGFVHGDRFYTREQAASAVRAELPLAA
jgi:hypothetical protein